MTCLEEIEKEYSKAKDLYFASLHGSSLNDLHVQRARMETWDQALQLCQKHRGNFVG